MMASRIASRLKPRVMMASGMKRMRLVASRGKRGILLAAILSGVALLTVAALPILWRLYETGWIHRDHYHVVFAALCIVPAAVAHCSAAYSGLRESAWWTVWLPGIAVFAAFPWRGEEGWQALWIFGHAWDWVRTIFLHWDATPPFVFNSFAAFVAVLTMTIVSCGKLWLGASRAVGRLGPGKAAAAEDALPSAEWASRSEIVDRFSVKGGIVLGELTDPTSASPDFSPERPESWGGQGEGQLITMSPTDGNGHVLVTSQASGYKSTGLVIPNILTYDDPLVVFDPKCELYSRTHKARRKMGYHPVVIDARNGFDPARLIAALAKEHPSAYRRMAKMVIPQGHSGIENAAYFKAAATHLLTALLAYFAETDSPNILQDVARVLARSADGVHGVVGKRSKKSRLAFVRNQLGALKGMDAKFFASVKTEITNQLSFAEMPDIERYITMDDKSELPSQIIDPKCDIFLNIPQNVAEDFAPMVRLMLGSMLTAAQLIEVNEDPRARRLFLIDEAAKLGGMDILENIRDRGRSIGLHLMMFYQTPGEVTRIWGPAGTTSWRDGCSATVMGPVSSRTSAEELSAMLGTETLRVKTEGTSSSSQVLSVVGGSVSKSEHEQLRDVRLLTATAISQLPTHASIVTATGRKPILATKAIYFTRKDMKERVRSTKDIRDELSVTKLQKTLTKRLADMSRPDGEGESGPGANEPMAGSGIDPAAIEIEKDVEPPWAAAGADQGPDRASPKLSEQAMVHASRYGRREGRPRKFVPRKKAVPEETPGRSASNGMATDTGNASPGPEPAPGSIESGPDRGSARAPCETTGKPGNEEPGLPAPVEPSGPIRAVDGPDPGGVPASAEQEAPESRKQAPIAAGDVDHPADVPDGVQQTGDAESAQMEPATTGDIDAGPVETGEDIDRNGLAAGASTAVAAKMPSRGPEVGLEEQTLTDEEAGQVMKLGQDGLSIAEIARVLGKDPAMLSAWNRGQRARGLLPDFGDEDSGGPAGDVTGPDA